MIGKKGKQVKVFELVAKLIEVGFDAEVVLRVDHADSHKTDFVINLKSYKGENYPEYAEVFIMKKEGALLTDLYENYELNVLVSEDVEWGKSRGREIFILISMQLLYSIQFSELNKKIEKLKKLKRNLLLGAVIEGWFDSLLRKCGAALLIIALLHWLNII